MYHIYRVDIEDTSYAWHIYAKAYSDASDIARAVMDEIVDECDDLAHEIDFQEIRDGFHNIDEFSNTNPYREERVKINEFFEKFDSTLMKQYETMGGYVLDYKLYSAMKRGKIKDETAIYEFEYIYDERELFRIEEIEEVQLNDGQAIDIPDYNTHIEAKIVINKRDERDLLEWAVPALKIPCEFAGNANELGREKCYILKLEGIQQFCQLLNYVPYVKIVGCDCNK